MQIPRGSPMDRAIIPSRKSVSSPILMWDGARRYGRGTCARTPQSARVAGGVWPPQPHMAAARGCAIVTSLCIPHKITHLACVLLAVNPIKGRPLPFYLSLLPFTTYSTTTTTIFNT